MLRLIFFNLNNLWRQLSCIKLHGRSARESDGTPSSDCDASGVRWVVRNLSRGLEAMVGMELGNSFRLELDTRKAQD
jgi:hypothetical protein